MTTVLSPRPVAPSRQRLVARPGHREPQPTSLGRGRAVWNTLKTAVLLGALGGLLVLVGSLFGEVGAVIGVGAGLLLVGGSYWFSDRLALRAAGAVPVGPWVMPEYHSIVRDLCRESGLPMPRLYVTPDAQPNAFATGRNPRHASIAVTRGLLQVLSPEELRAVLAHELAHIRNRDILLSSIAAAVATGITFLAEIAGWMPFFGGSEDDDDVGPLGWLVAALLAPVAAALLQLALSRTREFEADRTGAALLGEGHALARALARIDAVARRTPMQVEPTQAGKYFVNPLTGREFAFARLFMTHPPVHDRIARLTRTPVS